MSRHLVAHTAARRNSERTAREVFFAMLVASVGCAVFAASSLGLLTA